MLLSSYLVELAKQEHNFFEVLCNQRIVTENCNWNFRVVALEVSSFVVQFEVCH
jgi:hypothetical protein